jgi:hypothetical protein
VESIDQTVSLCLTKKSSASDENRFQYLDFGAVDVDQIDFRTRKMMKELIELDLGEIPPTSMPLSPFCDDKHRG